MIKPNAELSIARQAKLLGVSRSSVYYHPKPESNEELDLLKRLDELFTENPMYGSRRLQAMLKREGVLVGRRRIRRLMKKLGLWAVTPLRQNCCRLDRISPLGGDKGWRWQGIQRSSKVER